MKSHLPFMAQCIKETHPKAIPSIHLKLTFGIIPPSPHTQLSSSPSTTPQCLQKAQIGEWLFVPERKASNDSWIIEENRGVAWIQTLNSIPKMEMSLMRFWPIPACLGPFGTMSTASNAESGWLSVRLSSACSWPDWSLATLVILVLTLYSLASCYDQIRHL